ncbi:MAG: hypothetical protein EKK45_17805 [Curvibacter sp.]|nr:MAG: hypothetical protein EKK45_17805 [Curvibacter sp.]
MGPIELLNHLANFVAPALFVSALLVLMGPVLGGVSPFRLAWYWKLAINFAVGVLALMLAVLVLGRDGKVAGYGLLLASVATSQWFLQGAWRR